MPLVSCDLWSLSKKKESGKEKKRKPGVKKKYKKKRKPQIAVGLTSETSLWFSPFWRAAKKHEARSTVCFPSSDFAPLFDHPHEFPFRSPPILILLQSNRSNLPPSYRFKQGGFFSRFDFFWFSRTARTSDQLSVSSFPFRSCLIP